MYKTKQRLVPLSIALLLIFCLTACGDTGGKVPVADMQDQPIQDQSSSQNQPEPPSQNGEVTVLTYAKLSWDGPDRAMIDQFNRTHSDVQIEVVDYVGSDYDMDVAVQGRQRLLTEIASGKAPDIMELGYGVSVTGGFLPYRQLARKGYLEDLWPWIENDPDLGRDALMEAPFKAAEVDGGLYIAFSSVWIHTLCGAESVVGDRTSWSLADLQEAFDRMPEDSSVLPFYTIRAWAADILKMSLDNYIDWDTGTCSFDSPSFRAALEFLRDYFPAEGPGEWDDKEVVDRQMSGRQMLHRNVTNLTDIEYLNYMFGGPCSYVGYPVEDGSVGSAFYPATPDGESRQMLMSSTCKDKEAAWEFIRQILLPTSGKPQIDPKNIPYVGGIPVNRVDYEYTMNFLQQEDRYLSIYAPGYLNVECPAPTAEQIQRFNDFFNSIDKFILSDLTVYDIVMDAAAPYFAGELGIDETIQRIENRVGLYVNEQA